MPNSLMDLVYLCLAAAIPVLIPMLIGLLYHAIGQIRDSRVRDFALTAVQAAQQMIPSTHDRYDWASAELARRYPALNASQVQALIEAAVHQIKAAQPQALEALPGIVYTTRDIDPADEEE